MWPEAAKWPFSAVLWPDQVWGFCGSIHTPHKFQAIDEASWDKVVDVNLKGTFLCCQIVVEQFRKQGGGGKIVNISALAGRWLGSLAGCHYTAAKAGVIGLTRHLAHELGPEGIYVNAIAPCVTETPTRHELLERPGYKEWALGEMLPIRRWAQPEDFIGATLFLCSSLSDMIVGHVMMVDGGWTIH